MESVLKPQVDNVLGLKMHFTDVYLEELAKVCVANNYKCIFNCVEKCFRYQKGI